MIFKFIYLIEYLDDIKEEPYKNEVQNKLSIQETKKTEEDNKGGNSNEDIN